MAKISAMVKHANKPFNASQLQNFLPCVQIVSRLEVLFTSILFLFLVGFLQV
ncbi:hypothetical protein NC653_017318 [Populus alba x Populus x berolinensis]|uniref:Uncharacterized protein n=1 Tax=Populus alba x Populus x berolinensis TaxID=444605 RepID=A0AAD6W0G1_9ROSI|nr:hypothetical protein NC653_017318 [Populus alba x Populus x berolinensis]